MKNDVIKLFGFTTMCLLVFVIMSSLGVAFPVLYSMLLMGKFLLVYTVYRVLTDKFHTKMKFKDWYEDMPKKELDRI